MDAGLLTRIDVNACMDSNYTNYKVWGQMTY